MRRVGWRSWRRDGGADHTCGHAISLLETSKIHHSSEGLRGDDVVLEVHKHVERHLARCLGQ